MGLRNSNDKARCTRCGKPLIRYVQEEDIREELCAQADCLGMDSLTEEELQIVLRSCSRCYMFKIR